MKPRLLNPGPSSNVQIEMYMLSLGSVKMGDGPQIVLQVNPPVVFRPNRLSVNAHISIKYPLWMRLLSWIVIPWISLNIDDFDPDIPRWRMPFQWELWEFQWIQPIQRKMLRLAEKQQVKALASCSLKSLKVGNTELLMGESVPLGAFYYGFAPSLDSPTVSPQYSITAEFQGFAKCAFDVMMSGYAAIEPSKGKSK